jgi:hypothetical protein
LAATGTPKGWDGTGALTPLDRFATMFSGVDIAGVDGTEWYFPQRLTADTRAVANGIDNPAQAVLGMHATMGKSLPKDLRIFAFAASLGGTGVVETARLLAQHSGIADANVTLVDRHETYAHNDPAGAYPKNEFVDGVIGFLTPLGQ